MSEFRMPALGADMQFGTIVDWRVKPGDTVKRGDVVALVETEKGVIEVEIFESGVIESLIVQPGQKVPVGAPLAILSGDGKKVEAPPAESPAISPAPTPPVKEAAVPPTISLAPTAETATRLRVSPLARKRAQELGVDLASVTATGAEGSITVADVERAAESESPPSAPIAPAVKGLDLAAMRRVIAAAMARSKREIPHYYLSTAIDMRRAMDWLATENAKRPVTQRLLYSALLLRAVALALRAAPELNGFWIDDTFRASEAIHVGVAISLRQGGLINPAIHDVDKKSLDEVMVNMLDLVNRARTGHLRSSELSDGTITVTNLGEQGVESVFGVIYPPQVALVGFGKITERPVAKDGLVGARPMIEATLSADHRVSDGHRGGRFLVAIDRLLQEPEKL
ncbi:MAG: dihydrolipoamide acetyltransferase family protein [Chloroflexota bacterium]